MTSDPLKNNIDDDFIDHFRSINEDISNLLQDYIKNLVQHEVDVITDSDWFSEKVYEAVDAVRDSKNV
tara:strand:+ start:505 stop:708 length:204 start_codon:yes stop_codon:yes gene_type:complete